MPTPGHPEMPSPPAATTTGPAAPAPTASVKTTAAVEAQVPGPPEMHSSLAAAPISPAAPAATVPPVASISPAVSASTKRHRRSQSPAHADPWYCRRCHTTNFGNGQFPNEGKCTKCGVHPRLWDCPICDCLNARDPSNFRHKMCGSCNHIVPYPVSFPWDLPSRPCACLHCRSKV